jgi:hypothetical protein
MCKYLLYAIWTFELDSVVNELLESNREQILKVLLAHRYAPTFTVEHDVYPRAIIILFLKLHIILSFWKLRLLFLRIQHFFFSLTIRGEDYFLQAIC